MQKSSFSLCVFCASSDALEARYLDLAVQAGHLAAHKGWRVVYGGAKGGMMGALANSALSQGGEVIGVIPEVLGPQERAHNGLSELYVVPDMHARQKKMADLADGFLVLPGGLGTLAEFFEIVTWKAIGLHAKPIVLLNAFGYWNALDEQMRQAQNQGFLHGTALELFTLKADLGGLEQIFA